MVTCHFILNLEKGDRYVIQIFLINCVPVLPCWVTWGNTSKILLTCVTIGIVALLEDQLNLTLEVVADHTLKQ